MKSVVLLSAFVIGCAGPDDPSVIVTVVKDIDQGWFVRLGEGVSEAGTELGVTASMVGPKAGDPPDTQLAIIEGLIADEVDAIAVVPNDAAALEDVLAEAQAAGILVLTHESPDQQNADWDLETIDNNKFGQVFFDSLGERVGGEGQFGLFVGGAELHDFWADRGLEHAATAWPGLELVAITDETLATCAIEGTCRADRVVCGEDADLSAQATADLLTAYPDLVGIVGFGSQSPLGAGAKLQELDRNDVVVVGVAIPSAAEALLVAGFIDDGYLWDPKDAGYGLVAVAERILAGEAVETGTVIGSLGAAVVDAQNRDIYFDKTLQVTAENAGELGF